MASVTFKGGYTAQVGSAKHSRVNNPEPTEDEAEVVEMGAQMKQLLENHLFKKLIVDEYINKQALFVGTSFSGSKSDLEMLSAITHLANHINAVITDGELARG